MPPKRARVSRSRQTTPQSVPQSSATRTSPRQTRTSQRGQSRDRTASPNQRTNQAKSTKKPLPQVDEEVQFVQSEDGIEVIDVVQSQIQSELASSLNPDESVRTDSSIDDTSSNGTTQLEALDIDLIVDSLNDLHQDSNKLLSLFDVDDVLEAVRDVNAPLTKIGKRFRNFSSRFNTSRLSYGDGAYLDVSLILRKIADGSAVVDGPWRPDPVLQIANLGTLTANLVVNDDKALHDTLERMFNTFPEPFVEVEDSDGSKWFSKYRSETLSFDIALRTQFFLSTVEKSINLPSFDPDNILNQVFFDEDGNLYAITQITGPTTSNPETIKMDEQTILNHLSHVRSFFKKTGRDPIDLTPLRRKYLWPSFLALAFDWIFARKRWLETRIKDEGGVEAIRERIEKRDLSPHPHNPTQTTQGLAGAPNRTNGQAPKLTPTVQRASPRTNPKVLASRVAAFKKAKARDEELDNQNAEHEPKQTRSQHTPLADRTPLKDTNDRVRANVSEIPQSPEVAAVEDENDNALGPQDDEIDADAGVSGTPSRAVISGESAREMSPPRPTQSSIVPTQQTRNVLEVAREQAALGNKENIDTTRRGYNAKKASAVRLEWNDSQTGKKRAHSEVDGGDEDEDDDEFETDERPQKRTRLPHQQPQSKVDEWINNEDEEEDDENEEEGQKEYDVDDLDEAAEVQNPTTDPPEDDENHAESSRPPPSAQPEPQRRPRGRPRKSTSQTGAQETTPRPSGRPPKSHPHPHPQPRSRSHSRSQSASVPPATQHSQINQLARANMRLRPLLDPGSNNRRPQGRRPWTAAEINRLYDLMAQHGCGWAQIMAEDGDHPDGPLLQERGQVGLKDKARNLKMDYLKAGQPLPPGFVGVTIKANDKTLLDSLGLPWE